MKESERHGGLWTEDEITTFCRRKDRLMLQNMSEVDAEEMAEAMLYRDRPESGDHRRICLECSRLVGNLCREGRTASLSRQFEPIKTILWHCHGFKIKGKV